MGGVPDEDDAAGVPVLLFDPFDGGAVDLLVGFQAAQVVADSGPEACEPVAQPVQPALYGIALALVADVRGAVGMTIADRAQSEESSVSEGELHARRLE